MLPARQPARGSQCERILAVLADGEDHLVREIHERAGFSRLNSRVAELRKRGWQIECFHIGGEIGSDGYGYRLLSAGPEPKAATSAASSFPPPAHFRALPVVASGPAEQLELVPLEGVAVVMKKVA